MSNKQYISTNYKMRWLAPTLALAVVMVVAAACNLPGGEAEEPVDPDAQLYRMYYDSSADPEVSELQIRQFTGQIRMADVDDIFGDIDDLPQDESGNYSSGPALEEGLLWSLFANASQSGVNLVTSDLDGTLSSALDLDGDGITDILDIWLGDGRRFTFVTEGLGMGVFEDFLRGINPLCNSALGGERGFAIWDGCADDEEGDGGEGGGGGGVAGAPGSSFVDPIGLICGSLGASRGFSSQTRGVGRLRPGERYTDNSYDFYYETGESDPATRVRSSQFTAFIENESGNIVRTIKTTIHSDSPGELLGLTTEEVDSEGNGIRVTRTFNSDGTTTTQRLAFTTRLDENSDYNSYETTPPATIPEPPSSDTSEEGSGEEPPADPPPEEPSDTGNPGPEGGDDFGLADFCDRRRNATSGVEQAAAPDPTA